MEIYKNLDLEDMAGEIWKDIEGFEKKYQISNMGRVKALNFKRSGKEKIMKQCLEKSGYLRITLSKNNKQKKYSVHRMTAMAFIPNIENKKEVNHKNTNTLDNRVENLEWATPKENMNNPLTLKHLKKSKKNISEETRKKLKIVNTKSGNPQYKGFICVFLNGEITEEMTKRELGEMLGISDTTVADIAKSNKPYKPFPKRLKYLNGIRIYYAEDYLKLESGDNNVS